MIWTGLGCLNLLLTPSCGTIMLLIGHQSGAKSVSSPAFISFFSQRADDFVSDAAPYLSQHRDSGSVALY